MYHQFSKIQNLQIEIPNQKNPAKPFILENTTIKYVNGLETLQRKVFTSLSNEEILTAELYAKHLEVFPEGQFLIRDQDKVIGMTSTMMHKLETGHHTFLEISGNLEMTTYQPHAKWLYGLDLGIDPDYRGMGLARYLYVVRQNLCRKLHLKGQFTVGMPIGYFDYRNKMTMEQYFEKLQNNKIKDPTISMQQKIGFEIKGLIPNYLSDENCANYGVLLILDVNKEV